MEGKSSTSSTQVPWDLLVVGGGLSGLYAAYKTLQRHPMARVLVLEGKVSGYLGGRIGNDTFYGATIVTGAGVARKRKDKFLRRLLRELGIVAPEERVVKEVAGILATSGNRVDTRTVYREWEAMFAKAGRPRQTVRAFFEPRVGRAALARFVDSAGYGDYLDEDADEFFTHYGFDDTYSGWTCLRVPWRELVDRLVDAIERAPGGNGKVLTSRWVTAIETKGGSYLVQTRQGPSYVTHRLVFATTVASVRKLLPGLVSSSLSWWDTVHPEVLLRQYLKFDAASAARLRTVFASFPPRTDTLLLAGPLAKLVRIDTDKGVYEVYTDSDKARVCEPHCANTEAGRRWWATELAKTLQLPSSALRILAMRDYNWHTGEHYYEPLPADCPSRTAFVHALQHPTPHVWVVGEVVSRNQGWTEGALESVEAVWREWIKER